MVNENLESKRWWIAIAAVVMQLCLGTVYAWSVFKKPLMTMHGWAGNNNATGIYYLYVCCRHISGFRRDSCR